MTIECEVCGHLYHETEEECPQCAKEIQHGSQLKNNWEDDSWIEEDWEDDEDDIFGYECVGCQHVQDHGGYCDACGGYCVDPMYF